ncbi:MAG TPA: diguanylate cyclase [Candidatus Sulfotelmatobacter sp.]|jgi:diguanylate cyclase (GGDEF)-like protein/PAS domain S-box-containing protein
MIHTSVIQISMIHLSTMQGSYDLRMVALSVVFALFASYAALNLVGRVTAAHGAARAFWLSGGAVSMGVGIWSMHYIGMLALSLPIPVLYHYPTVIVSLLAAIGASAVALFTVSRKRVGYGSFLMGSLAMGGGIAGMHYIGMAAMRMPASMEYRTDIVALSILIAVLVALVALALSFQVRRREEGHEKSARVYKATSVLIMGSAIPLMHYTAMAAVRFHPSGQPFSAANCVHISHLGIDVISVASGLTLTLAIVTSFLDRMLAMQRAAACAAIEGEVRFHTLAETIPQIVWTAVPGCGLDYCNHRWSELTGLGVETALGSGWQDSVHPDDLPLLISGWQSANPTDAAFEIEYRLRAASGEFRWHLFRAVPVCDSEGVIEKWFGVCLDIEDQRRNQQHLEEQIRAHTAALLEANLRLESEMRERALAQQELNAQNERIMQELQSRSSRATMLAKMAELLQSCVGMKDALSVIAGMAPKIFPEMRGAVLLMNSSRDLLEVAASWSGCDLSAAVFAPQDCWALRTGHLHMVAAGDATAQCNHVRAASGAYFCMPLFSQGEAAGVVHFQIVDAATEPSESLTLLVTMFAEQVGLSITNLRLREALHHQSIRDPLTGLYNRRYLEEMAQRETRRAVRAEHGLGLLILDLDHFKKFNDNYGHDAGDTVLRETAALLTKSVRAEDIVCRYGGEEFVIVLPMADLKATQSRAEKIRTRLHELALLHKGVSLGLITASIGVAALPEHGTSPKELIDAADAALYRAKREGRDRVVMATLPQEPEPGLGAIDVPAQESRIHVS